MATANPTQGLHGTGSLLNRASGWLIAIGVLFITLGTLAIAEPFVAGLAIAFAVGWFLLFGGIAHFVSAFGGGGLRRSIVQFLIGVVYVAGGLYFLTHPLLGLGTLTLLLAAIILTEAVFEIVLYFRHRETTAPVGCSSTPSSPCALADCSSFTGPPVPSGPSARWSA